MAQPLSADSLPPLETIAGARVLFVMAAPAEYGAELRSRIRPVITGVGPIEGGIGTALALAALAAAGRRPDLVVSLGSAGSRTLEQGAVYQAISVSWRDIDASPLGFAKGLTPLLDLPAELPLPTPLHGIPRARLSTGADVVSGEAAYAGIDADMVDMETFAALRACQRFAVPLLAWRGISDGAADLHHYDDWTSLLHVVDRSLALAVDELARVLETEGLPA